MKNKVKHTKQFFTLLIASGMNIFLNLLLTLILTNILTVDDYGLYRYVFNLYNILAVILQLGISHSTSIALTRTDDEEKTKAIITFASLLMFSISIISSIVVIIVFSILLYVGVISNYLIVFSIIFAYTVVMHTAYLEILKGANAINSLAFQTVGPNLFMLVLTGIAWYFARDSISFLIVLGCHVLAYTFVAATELKAFWQNIKGQVHELRKEIEIIWKQSGFNIYIGSIFGVASTYIINSISGLIISLGEYGVYSLGLSLATPMQIIPSTMGNILYKESAKSAKLPKSNIVLTILISIFALLTYSAVLLFVLPKIFPAAYSNSFGLGVYLSVASSLYGLGDYFNRYIAAKGRGDYLRNASTISGIVNVIASVILMMLFGVIGLVLGRILGGFSYMISLIFGYSLLVKEKEIQ